MHYPIAAAAVLALFMIASLLGDPSRLAGRNSDLRFTDPITAGASVSVEYDAALSLAEEDSVVIRARYRASDDRRYRSSRPVVVAGVLHRRPEGTFQGSVSIPEWAVYGVFAVETADGVLVDSRGRRLWEVLIGGPDSRRAALQQKVNDLLDRNWQEAARTQRELAESYPWDAPAWKDVYYLDLEVTPHAARDSLRAWHQERFNALDARYREMEELTGEVAGELMWYARGLADTTAAERWRQLLLARFPQSPRAVEERVATMDFAITDEALLELERLWQEVGPAHISLPQTAALLALGARRGTDAQLWLERYVGMRPELELWAAGSLSRIPESRPASITMLRIQVAERERFSDERRPLELSRSEFEIEARPTVAGAMFRLAEAYLAAADTMSASRVLEGATELDWHTDALRLLASLRAPTDPEAATAILARASADPGSHLDENSATALLEGQFVPSVWARELADERQRLREYVLAGASEIPLPGDHVLVDSAGVTHRLSELLDGRPAVIAFWSPFCSPSIDILPELQQLSDSLTSRGATLLLVTTEPLDEAAVAALQGAGVRTPAYVDATTSLSRTLGLWRTPELFVVDALGRIRFESTSLQRVERQVLAVSER